MIKAIYYLAGLFDGEASFGWRAKNGPVIQLRMTDFDTVSRVGRIVGKCPTGPYQYDMKRKPYWVIDISGGKAVGWMLTLYPLLSLRRQARIKDVVTRWKISPNRGTNSFQTR